MDIPPSDPAATPPSLPKPPFSLGPVQYVLIAVYALLVGGISLASSNTPESAAFATGQATGAVIGLCLFTVLPGWIVWKFSGLRSARNVMTALLVLFALGQVILAIVVGHREQGRAKRNALMNNVADSVDRYLDEAKAGDAEQAVKRMREKVSEMADKSGVSEAQAGMKIAIEVSAENVRLQGEWLRRKEVYEKLLANGLDAANKTLAEKAVAAATELRDLSVRIDGEIAGIPEKLETRLVAELPRNAYSDGFRRGAVDSVRESVAIQTKIFSSYAERFDSDIGHIRLLIDNRSHWEKDAEGHLVVDDDALLAKLQAYEAKSDRLDAEIRRLSALLMEKFKRDAQKMKGKDTPSPTR